MSACHRAVAALLAGLCACGDQSSGGGAAGASDAGLAVDAALHSARADAGSKVDAGLAMEGGSATGEHDASIASCQDQGGSCPASHASEWKTLLRAQDLEVTARFVSADEQAVLALTATGEARVALTADPHDSGDVKYTVWSAPKAALKPVAVTSGTLSSSSAPEPFVLACNDDHSHCEVLQGKAGQSALMSFTADPLPAGFVARGLVVDRATTPVQLCVYGNGIACFEHGWESSLPVTDGLMLNHLAIGSLWSLAVGDAGRWYKRVRQDSGLQGSWQAQPTLGNVTLNQASVAGMGGIILGEGQLQAALGEQANFRCQAPAKLSGIVLNEGSIGAADAVTSTGDIVQRMATGNQGFRYCTTQKIELGEVLDVTSAPCGGSLNPRLLTPSTLIGQYLCVVL